MRTYATRWFPRHRTGRPPPRVRVRMELKVTDFWIGCYPAWSILEIDIWICLIPCFPIHVQVQR